MFYLVKKDELCYYKIKSFENSGLVSHCFTTKLGGVSKGPYESMNLRLSSGDSCDNILKNYQIIADELKMDYKSFVLSKQVHKTDVVKVTNKHKGNGLIRENEFLSADSLVTNEKGIPLCTFYADCVPIFLLDTKKEVLALVHSGWRGTVNNISGKTVKFMTDNFDSDPSDIIAAIGPSVRQENFEVGFEVSDEFINAGYSEFIDNSQVKPHIDLQGVVKHQLIKSGVKESAITDSELCTVKNSDIFFSHRVMGDQRGTMAAIAMLK